MTLNADLGTGATLTLSEDTTAYEIVSIQVGEETLEAIDVSTLATTGPMEYIPADNNDTPELSVTVNFRVDHGLPAIGSTHTATVTFPLGPAQTTTTKATFAGTGFVTNRGFPELTSNQKQEGSFSIKFDGDTGPTFTAGS